MAETLSAAGPVILCAIAIKEGIRAELGLLTSAVALSRLLWGHLQALTYLSDFSFLAKNHPAWGQRLKINSHVLKPKEEMLGIDSPI